MHGTKTVGAFHEPRKIRVRARIESGGGPPHSKTLARWPESLELPPGFGVRRPCGALDFPGRFRVPMQAEKTRKSAFQKPGAKNNAAAAANFLLLLEERRVSDDESAERPLHSPREGLGGVLPLMRMRF